LTAARSTFDLFGIVKRIADAKPQFRSLAEPLGRHHHLARPADADRARRPAEFERDLIRARTGERRARAKARGVKLGRKPKLTAHQKREAIRGRDRDGEPVREIARSYNVCHNTISRLTA
jgi:DNA invertase Pin-like site-specific DNA recombinase